MPKSEFKFHTPLRVRWMECDAQGIVFNGSYMGFLEVGQSEYFRHLGFIIYRLAQQGYFDTAVVKTLIEFKAPARVDDLLDLFVRVSHIGNTSYTMDMEIYPEGSDQLLTMVQAVYVGYLAGSGKTRPVPGDIRELLNHFETNGEVLPLARFPGLASAAD
jgi:acyl-CoA thioester hydrolase